MTVSPYFATHAGMLRCVAREFAELGRGDGKDERRFALYARILDRMIVELTDHGGEDAPSSMASLDGTSAL